MDVYQAFWKLIENKLDAEGLLSLESITTHDVERLRAALMARSVPLNAEARAVLKNDTNVPPKSTYFVFDVPGRASPSLLRRITERIAVAIGRPFNLHLLRHKFASNLLARGGHIAVTAERTPAVWLKWPE